MAKKSRKSSSRSGRTVAHPPSRMTREEFYLNKHDEEKVLLFTTGMLLGVGIVLGVLQNVFWYGWLSAIAIVLILLYVELRQAK